MKSVYLFFILAGLVLADDNLNCETTHSLSCSEPVKRELDRKWPETEEQLDNLCKNIYDDASGCSKVEETICKDAEGRVVSTRVTTGTHLSKHLCDKKSDLRQFYLKSVRCINQNSKTLLLLRDTTVCKNKNERERILELYEETCGKDARAYMNEVFKVIIPFCRKDNAPSNFQRSMLFI